MKKEDLLKFYDAYKIGEIYLMTGWNCKVGSTNITLEDLFRMFEAVRERNENAVSQD